MLSVRDRGETPCAHVAMLIESHARELQERIDALDAMRKDLVRLSRRARQRPAREADYCHIIELDGQ